MIHLQEYQWQLHNGKSTDAIMPVVSPTFAEIRLATGVTLHYLEQGAATGEVIIFLHGYTDSWHSFALNLPRLSREYHVFALDQRGHGGSSKDADDYTMESLAADVITFMDAKGIAQATIVGHSMGSLVAQLVAIHHPARLSRLVLIGGGAQWGNEAIVELHEFVQTLTDPVSPNFIADFQTSTVHAPVPRDFFEEVIAESSRVPTRVWHQALASLVQYDMTSRLAEIVAPTLILWGDHDSVFSRRDQEILHTHIPHATLLTYAETGHALQWEHPDQFVHDLAQFLLATAA